ncbi:hypothetical protein [Kocuria nitroreducens]|uniref:hypothetical protein n=1 Tax=Kocuria nitroreducens TaxID=3058914 RepID=UPI0036D8C4D6
MRAAGSRRGRPRVPGGGGVPERAAGPRGGTGGRTGDRGGPHRRLPPPELLASRLPLVSVHADGRVITQAPQIQVFPPPALPVLQVQHVDEDAVPVLVERALRAGAGETTDLGRPPVADLPSTRFTVRTPEETYVREVYALGAETPAGPGGGPDDDDGVPPGPDSGLTADQLAARAELQALVEVLGDPASVLPDDAVGEQEIYVPEAVAGVVTEWRDPGNDPEPRPVPWPGPPLPGEPLEPRLGLSCVLATGEQARAVLDAAGAADAQTPWVSEDDRRWSVALRPLLPHEEDCTDLAGY